jgi:hypothetical protein
MIMWFLVRRFMKLLTQGLSTEDHRKKRLEEQQSMSSSRSGFPRSDFQQRSGYQPMGAMHPRSGFPQPAGGFESRSGFPDAQTSWNSNLPMRPMETGLGGMGYSSGLGAVGQMMGGGYGVEDIGLRRPALDGLGFGQPAGKKF